MANAGIPKQSAKRGRNKQKQSRSLPQALEFNLCLLSYMQAAFGDE